MSIDRTRQLTDRAIGKCTPNAERLSNAVKNLIDRVMRGDVFQNPSAAGILAWLLCTDDLKRLIEMIPPWGYNGPGSNPQVNGVPVTVTPAQAYFYERITSVGGTELLTKLRTLQYGGEAQFSSSATQQQTLSNTIGSQQQSMNEFKTHTDNQSGVGDPTTFMRTMGLATAFDSGKQQMEGQNQDNFSSFFNSTIQGPIVVDQMRKILCEPDAIGQALARLLALIASALPFSLDDLVGLLGGLSLDEFFAKLDGVFSQLASFFEYLNYLVSLDFSRFQFAQLWVTKYTLGQFLAALVRGEGRGNCIMRALLEEFTGSENLRGAIQSIDLERKREERRSRQFAAATSEAERQRINEEIKQEKEVFFEPVPEDLIYQGTITGTPAPTTGPSDPEQPELDSTTTQLIAQKLAEIDQRTMQMGYQILELVMLVPTPKPMDGGYFNEFQFDTDGVKPIDFDIASHTKDGGYFNEFDKDTDGIAPADACLPHENTHLEIDADTLAQRRALILNQIVPCPTPCATPPPADEYTDFIP